MNTILAVLSAVAVYVGIAPSPSRRVQRAARRSVPHWAEPVRGAPARSVRVGVGVLTGALVFLAAELPMWISSVVAVVVGAGAMIGAGKLETTSYRRRIEQRIATLPDVLTLLAGLGWAFGNLASRLAAAPRPLHLTLWMTVVPPIPMLALSLVVEGPERIGTALTGSLTPAAIPAWLGLAYTTVIATVIGSGIWTWLMARHSAGTVAPFSMLVPVTGLALAWLVLAEVPATLELLGGVLVIAGVWWASTRARRTPPPEDQPGDALLDVAPPGGTTVSVTPPRARDTVRP